jgi:hypothetical protein
MRKKTRKLVASLVSVTIVILTMLVMATGANAAAFTYDAYPPDKSGPTMITAWANLSRDCTGTYGCWNYMKIERTRLWGIEYVGGKWATDNGWNSLEVNLPDGCYDYRTFVDSYTDALISLGLSADYKVIGASATGEKIVRFHRVWNSGFVQICR